MKHTLYNLTVYPMAVFTAAAFIYMFAMPKMIERSCHMADMPFEACMFENKNITFGG